MSKICYKGVTFLLVFCMTFFVIGCDLGSFAAEPAGQEKDTSGFDFVSTYFDDKTALYEYQEGAEIAAGIWVKLKSTNSKDISGEIRLTIFENEERSNGKAGKPVAFTLKANQETSVYASTPAVTQPGYYATRIEILSGGNVIKSRDVGFGVIHKANEGIIEDSMFGINAREEQSRDRATMKEICKRIGVKWLRGVFGTSPKIVKPTKDGPYWDDAKIKAAINSILEWRKNGILSLGGVDYNTDWNIEPIDGKTPASYQNRPADLNAQADIVYHMIKPLKDYVKYFTIWNEPWIHGWTWATGDAEDYREMARLIYQKVREDKSLDDIEFIGGGSTAFSRDCLYPMDENGKHVSPFLDGTENHGYGIPEPGYIASIAVQSYLDKNYSVGKGKAGLWQTEFGAALQSNIKSQNQYDVARAMTPLHIAQLQGANGQPLRSFWFALCNEGKYSGDDFNVYDGITAAPKPPVVAYSALTKFLEYKKLAEHWDVYPESKNLMGYVLEDKRDGKATGVIYLDILHEGTVTINNAKGLKIYDYMGKPISDGAQNTVKVNLKHWESIYVVSDKKSSELSAILKDADFDIKLPVLMYPQSFTKPLTCVDKIDMLVENATGKPISGDIKLTSIPEGWTLKKDQIPVENILPGEKRTVSFPIKTYKESSSNRYDVTYKANFANESWDGMQTFQVAYAPKKTIAVDGDLSDWKSVPEVSVYDNAVSDVLKAVMDPSLKIADSKIDKSKRVKYTAKTAWDDQYFYFSAQIPDTVPVFKKPFMEDQYSFPFQTDSVQLAFDCLEKNPDDFFYGIEGYDKYYGSDLDYEFCLRQTVSGDGSINSEVSRLTAPGTNYQTFYPTCGTLNPPVGSMDASESGGKEGKVKVTYDQAKKLFNYEAAISLDSISDLRNQLKQLSDESELATHFAFAVNDMGANGKGTSYWTREAGIVVSGAYGFSPRWRGANRSNGGRILTPWGFGNYDLSPMKVTLNGENLAMDVAPTVVNDRTMVPLRAIFEALGATVEWNEAESTVTAKKDNKTIKLQINNTSAEVNGTQVNIDSPATVIHDRTMVPVRFIAESLGAQVEWNEATSTVVIRQ